MKKGWQIKRLGDVCEIIKGRKPVLKNTRSNDDLPYLVAKVMRGSKEAEYASVKDRNSILVEESETIIICDGSNSGEIFTGFRGILSSTMGKISKKTEIDDNYLRAFLASTFEVFNGAKTGAAIPHLDMQAMYQLEFPLAPLSEQKRIVALLDSAFYAIDKAKANTEQNLKNARELFENQLQEIFNISSNRWSLKLLQDVSLIFGRGRSRHRPRNDPKLYGGKYPFIQTGDIRNSDHEIKNYTQTYNEVGLAQSKLWPKGTICITIAANIAETGILSFEACFPDSVIGMVVDPKLAIPEFVEYVLQAFKQELKLKGKGSAQDNINLATFEFQKFPFPSADEQIEVVQKINILREHSRALESIYQRKLSALEELKKSLLARAFSGEL